MKALILVLALAGGLHADIVGPMPMQQIDLGASAPLTGSLTYALNQALTGTSSASIDLNGTVGLMLSLTGTSLVTAYYSNADLTYTTGAFAAFQMQSPGNYQIPAKARYVSFVNSGNVASGRVSAFYYAVAPSVAVTVPTPTPGILPVSVTASTNLNPVGMVVYNVLSATATMLNITTLAGSSVPCVVCLSSNGGAAAGFRIQWDPNATPRGVTASVGHYIAASTTAQCWGGFVPGTHLEIGGVAATSSVEVDVQKVQ